MIITPILTGEEGEIGAQGAPGPRGEAGDIGDMGAPGPAGRFGASGMLVNTVIAIDCKWINAVVCCHLYQRLYIPM